jgi:hypothetical protein
MEEALRPDPGFRIYVESEGERTDVTDAVMDVYDIAVGSMDFGSGFLSTEEVGNIRVLGKVIGAGHFDYQHDKCFRCGHELEKHSVATYKCWTCEYSHDPNDDCKGFVRSEGAVL